MYCYCFTRVCWRRQFIQAVCRKIGDFLVSIQQISNGIKSVDFKCDIIISPLDHLNRLPVAWASKYPSHNYCVRKICKNLTLDSQNNWIWKVAIKYLTVFDFIDLSEYSIEFPRANLYSIETLCKHKKTFSSVYIL